MDQSDGRDVRAATGRRTWNDCREQLQDGSYRPQAMRRVWIPKPGSTEKRPLGIPTVRDRVVQAALRHVLEPIFERDFAEQSYGFRPDRGCKDALRRVDELLKAGYTCVVDADLKSYFDTIPHEPLMERVAEKVSDGRVLALIEAFLNQQVMDGMKSWTPEAGTPQGAVLSPLLANIYLDPLDHADGAAGVRDGAVRGRLRDSVPQPGGGRTGLGTGAAMDGEQAGLTLHPAKTRIVDATQTEGFDFLGYHFERGYGMAAARRAWTKFKDDDPGQDATHQRAQLDG